MLLLHPTPNAAASFFVRVWQEPGDKNGQWRGEVRHVQSGENAYFCDAGDLLAFLAAHGGKELIRRAKKGRSQ